MVVLGVRTRYQGSSHTCIYSAGTLLWSPQNLPLGLSPSLLGQSLVIVFSTLLITFPTCIVTITPCSPICPCEARRHSHLCRCCPHLARRWVWCCVRDTLQFLQSLSGHTCLQFIHSQKACFEANPMVTFLFKMVHSFRTYGLDGFGWHSENSNSAVTHFVMLPLPRFCVPSPYSTQRALYLHVFASPVMHVRWHSVLFVQIKICTHKKYNKCLYICRQ